MYLTEQKINYIKNSELGCKSTEKLMEIFDSIKNGTIVDIGVEEGKSSLLMLNYATENNNRIYGIDPIPYFQTNHPNYTYMKMDSVKVGENWKGGQVDFVFFDSVHAKEQVLCELYFWYDLIKEGGYAVFHDTSWKNYIHKSDHNCAGKFAGNTGLGFDHYGGIDWETPDKAVSEFFKINLLPESRNINNDELILIHEDEYVKIETNFSSLGMTFVRKKKNFNFKNNIHDWKENFKRRKILMCFFN